MKLMANTKMVQERVKGRHLNTNAKLSVNSFAIMETNSEIIVTL